MNVRKCFGLIIQARWLRYWPSILGVDISHGGFSSWSTIYGNIGEPSEKSASNRKVILVNQKTDRESKTFTVHLFAPISLGSPIFSRPIRSTEKNLPKFFSQKQIYLICFLCFINQLNLSLFSFYRNLFLHFS